MAGLNVAWRLARKDHEVTVCEADGRMGVRFAIGFHVDAEAFRRIREESDAVIVATGGHVSRVFPWPGHERIVAGVDFLKAVNKGLQPKVGKSVAVIGCGNAGMAAAAGAFAMGAESATCIDVQKPAAFAHETPLSKRGAARSSGQ